MTPPDLFTHRVVLFTDKYFRSLIAMAVIVILFIGLQWVLIPTVQSLKIKSNIDFQNIEKTSRERKQVAERLEQAVLLYQNVDLAELRKMYQVLPNRELTIDLYSMIENMMNEAGVKVTTLSISKGPVIEIPNEAISIQSVNANITVETAGQYEELKSFTRMIETATPLFDLSSISFQPGQESLTLNLTTYYR